MAYAPENADTFMEGWEFANAQAGAFMGADMSHEWMASVQEMIDKLEQSINEDPHINLDVSRFQGFVFEDWTAGTYNINAAAAEHQGLFRGAEQPMQAEVLGSTAKGSVDVKLGDRDYSLKSYADGHKSAKAQLAIDDETGEGLYDGQTPVIPEDQIADARLTAYSMAAMQDSPEMEQFFSDMGDAFTDHISDGNGIESVPISRMDLDHIAFDAQGDGFVAEDYGITLEDATAAHALGNSVEAGITAATISLVLQLAPEVIKSVDYLVKNGELDPRDLGESGKRAASASASSFIRGTLSFNVQHLCEVGALGESLVDASPSMVAAVVVMTMQAVRSSVDLATGSITAEQMGDRMVNSAINTAFVLAGQKAGGLIAQALLPTLPGIGCLFGSLIGSSLVIAYGFGKKQLMGLCVRNGFTCFGLVDQDYTIPEAALKRMGIDLDEVEIAQVETAAVEFAQVDYAQVDYVYETVSYPVLKRGLIGVNRVGYVLG